MIEKNQDAYGRQMLAQFYGRRPTVEIIERDDDYIDTGSEPGAYFTEYDQWPELERRAVDKARGAVLDIGCGAGRHSLYLQNKEFDVTGIDNSPGAIEVCGLRGLKKAIVRPIGEIDRFEPASFETILMLGNNFGLFGDFENARSILRKMSRITGPEARIIAGNLDPYRTGLPDHLDYLESNKRRGRMPGQIRMRVRYGRAIGPWFDYLFVSPAEMEEILSETDWRIDELLDEGRANYYAVIGKKS